MTVVIISILFTIGILILTLFTISKGYGYKHTIDQLVKEDEAEADSETEQVKQL